MTKKTTSSQDEIPPHSPSGGFFSWKVIVSLSFAIIIGIFVGISLLNHLPWFAQTPNEQAMINLQDQAASLDQRMNHLDTKLKTLPGKIDLQENNLSFVKSLEEQITALSQKVEAIQSQGRAEGELQQIEKYHHVEKDIHTLLERQKAIQAFLLFSRLKAKVLSAAPYRMELDDFKAISLDSENLSLLEKHADHGLSDNNPPKSNSQITLVPPASRSWWDHLKTVGAKFIKIEKVDTTEPSSSLRNQDQQAVEKVLNAIEQTLTTQLTPIPITPTPQSGDSL